MITKEKLNNYIFFNGDIDGWARAGTHSQKEGMSDSDWFLIDNLMQDLVIAQNGNASADFCSTLEQKLADNCDSNETVKLLKNRTKK
jgi:hypothetical protein